MRSESDVLPRFEFISVAAWRASKLNEMPAFTVDHESNMLVQTHTIYLYLLEYSQCILSPNHI